MSNLTRTIIKLCSCLIPIKSQRKKFRNKFLTGKHTKKVKDKTLNHNLKIKSYQYTSIPTIELFFSQNNDNLSFNRYDTIVRLLAIENYYGLNDYGWALYEKMQNKRVQNGYATEAKERFIKLIKSWEQNGYDANSCIEVNKDIKLLDGSHRLAMALYHKQEEVSLRIDSDASTPQYGIDWFFEEDFNLTEIKQITERYENIKKEFQNGIYVSCILWSPVQKYFDEITKKINFLFPVKSIKDMEFSDDTYARMVKAIYSIDDIEDWKIEKKLEHMKGDLNKKIRFLKIFIENPKFRFKQLNNHTILRQGELLKKIIRNCYKDKVENYFYDIIIHTADNTTQTKFIEGLYNVDLQLDTYFKQIYKYEYVASKLYTPNLTKDFPKSFPFSKDVDLICSSKDYENIVNDTIKFFQSVLPSFYEIRLIKKEGKILIRIELRGYLIYQIDIANDFIYGKPSFWRGCFLSKKTVNGLFIPEEKYEICIRGQEYIANNNKFYHLEYIKDNQTKLDHELLKEYLGIENYNKILKLTKGEIDVVNI